jgi:hypothetical protein
VIPLVNDLGNNSAAVSGTGSVDRCPMYFQTPGGGGEVWPDCGGRVELPRPGVWWPGELLSKKTAPAMTITAAAAMASMTGWRPDRLAGRPRRRVGLLARPAPAFPG